MSPAESRQLTPTDRAELARPRQPEPRPPRPKLLTPEEYVAFATLASRFAGQTARPFKPITGGHAWRL